MRAEAQRKNTQSRPPVGNRACLRIRSRVTRCSCALACGRGRMAAAPLSAALGRPGCGSRNASAGSCLGSDGRKQTELQLQQQPRQQQQQQRHASRGPRGRKEMGDSPGSSGSGRPGHSQSSSSSTMRLRMKKLQINEREKRRPGKKQIATST